MTARDVVNSPAAKLVVFGAAFGVTYATLQAQVASKADKREVVEIRSSLDQMARDVRVLRLIACRQAIRDTYCEAQP